MFMLHSVILIVLAGGTCMNIKSALFSQLKAKLESLQSIECDKQQEASKVDVIKAAVGTCVSQCLQSGVALEEVQERLQMMHSEASLISGSVYKWAQQFANEIHSNRELEAPNINGADNVQPRSKCKKPLFCKDSVYHASICSLAVNVCTAGEYQQFFKKSPLVPGHTFQAVSISRSKQDRYLIAKQGDSTYYFAFQSEPKFDRWPKQFTSFSEGKLYDYCSC